MSFSFQCDKYNASYMQIFRSSHAVAPIVTYWNSILQAQIKGNFQIFQAKFFRFLHNAGYIVVLWKLFCAFFHSEVLSYFVLPSCLRWLFTVFPVCCIIVSVSVCDQGFNKNTIFSSFSHEALSPPHPDVPLWTFIKLLLFNYLILFIKCNVEASLTFCWKPLHVRLNSSKRNNLNLTSQKTETLTMRQNLISGH